MTDNVFNKLMTFLDKLEQNGVSYELAHQRDEALMVAIAVPGERWEVEFLSDGSLEIERFISNGHIYGEDVLSELFARFSEQENEETEATPDIVATGNVIGRGMMK